MSCIISDLTSNWPFSDRFVRLLGWRMRKGEEMDEHGGGDKTRHQTLDMRKYEKLKEERGSRGRAEFC